MTQKIHALRGFFASGVRGSDTNGLARIRYYNEKDRA